MKTTNKVVYQNLDQLFEASPTFELKDSDKWVIFSDLHMGDGGSTDDFRGNADLFKTALESFYLKSKYSLILNGDIEEMQRFRLKRIVNQWKSIYEVFDRFRDETRLIKTIGNHDLELQLLKELPFNHEHLEGFKFDYKGNPIFFFHGHQASKKFQQHNQLIGFTLKYFANPLGIKNYSVAHSSRKQYKIEKRAYHYSAYRKVVSIIGHTHRPLFESLHKVERLRYKIEQLIREYATDEKYRTDETRNAIKSLKRDLKKYFKQVEDTNFQSYVYNTIFHIPCLFNSGCVIGKRGMTCLEIENGKIRLVHWFDGNLNKKYLHKSEYQSQKIEDTEYYRMVLNEEPLEYIFTRIKFLT
ncbi:MAG: metallophosphoesterase family protein [Marinoscillum sp.]